MADGAGRIAEVHVSKTDKTKPVRIRWADPQLSYETHSPIFGDDRWPKWWIGEAQCGCPMCNDQDGRKQKARRERREGKRQAREWWREW